MDIDEAIEQFCAAICEAGINPPGDVNPDGEIHRFPTNGNPKDDAGWYVFYSDGIPAGSFGDWRNGNPWETWHADIGRELSPEELAENKARVEAMRRKREAEDARIKEAARKTAATIWNSAKPAPVDHPYLIEKGVKAHGLRVHNDALVVPMWADGELHSLQFIWPAGNKTFLTGGRVNGCYFSIGTPDSKLCVVEGYATGATVHEDTSHAVAVAFDSGNLPKVARALRYESANLCLVICADDDHEKDGNPGLSKAREAAQAAAALLAVPDFGEDRPSGTTDFNDLHRIAGPAAVRACIEKAAPMFQTGEAGASNRSDSHDEEPDLSLFGAGCRAVPPFPIELLGNYWAGWVKEQAKNFSAPIDYVAASLLGGVSALIANVRWPLAGAKWTEPPVLWIGLVGPPSWGKSPGMDPVIALIAYAEEDLSSGFDADFNGFEVASEIAKAEQAFWQADVKEAVKKGETAPAKPEGATAPDEPVRFRVRIIDYTTEVLVWHAATKPRGLLVARDELAGWFGQFDRYGGSGTDRAFAVQMYGGRYYASDRSKNKTKPTIVPHLSISVLGGVQPDIIDNIIKGDDDGLTARFFWVWPDSYPEFSIGRAIAVDETAAKNAFNKLSSLKMSPNWFGDLEPRIIKLSPSAVDILEKFGREMNARAETAVGGIAGTLGKARGSVLRLSAVLEYLWWTAGDGDEPEQISARAVGSAATLVEKYFLPMSARVFSDAGIPTAERHARILAQYIKAHGLLEFNSRKLGHEIGGKLREPKNMAEACRTLVEGNIIQQRFSRAGGSSGRQAKNYAVNPAIFAGPQ